MNKPVFIYSLHRSGSTYLKNILNCSKDVKMLEDEVHFDHPFFQNTFKKYYDKHCNGNSEKYDQFLKIVKENKLRGSYWRIYNKNYNVYSSKTFLVNKLSVWSSFNSILIQVLNDSDKKRIGIKYPVHFSYFNSFKENYPGSKNIYLVRDPRSIIASKFKSPTNIRLQNLNGIKYEIFRFFSLIYLSMEFRFFIKSLIAFEKEIYVVKYENLVLNKQNTINSVCKYCEIELVPEMLKAKGKSSGYSKPSLAEERIYRWKNILRKYETLIVDLITKKSRKKFGYE